MDAFLFLNRLRAHVRARRGLMTCALLLLVSSPSVFANHCGGLNGGSSTTVNVGTTSTSLSVQLIDVPDPFNGGSNPIVWTVASGYPNLGYFGAASNPQFSVTDATAILGGSSTQTLFLGQSQGLVTVTADGCGQQVLFDIALSIPVVLSKTSGDSQNGVPGSVLSPMTVHQSGGDPANFTYQILWQITSGDAVFSANNSAQYTSTIAPNQDNSATLKLGNTPGPIAVTATLAQLQCESVPCTVTNLGSTSFSATDTASPQLQKVAGDGQSGPPNTALPNPLTVRAVTSVTTVSAVDLVWQITSGDATFAASNTKTLTQTGVGTNTDSSVSLNLGTTPGLIAISVSCAQCGNGSVSFAAAVTAPSTPHLRKVSGDAQTGAPGSALALPLTVVIDDGGSGLTAADLVWQISGDASFAVNGSKTYSQNAVATNQNVGTGIVLGSSPGNVQVSVSCTQCAGAPVTFTETSIAPQLIKVSGDNASAAANASLPLVVRVNYPGTDITSVGLLWTVTSGSASFVASGSATYQQPSVALNRDNTVNVKLGPLNGAVTISVVCDKCATPVSFTLSNSGATGGGSAQLLKVSGDLQAGAVGAAGDAPLVVQLLDRQGQPLSGQTIAWQVSQGLASVDAAAATTDAQGRAQITFHHAAQAGTSVIHASIDTLAVDFSISSFLPVLTISGGDSQGASVGTTLPLPLTVFAAAPGTPAKALSGAVVVWSVVDGGGSLANATSVTDASGNAANTFKLGPTPGANHVQATLASGARVVFTATGTLVGAKLTAVSGAGQALPTYQPSQPLVVQLNDAQGKPIPGIGVQWAAPTHTTLSSTSSVTDTSGKASTVITIQLPGSVSVSAQTVGVVTTPVVFALNGGVANIPGLTPPEVAVAKAIDAACTALTLAATPTAHGQADLLARCTELVKNAGANPQPVAHALDAMLNNQVTPQISTGRSLQTAQIDNLNSRLDALRHGQHGASAQGLAFSNGAQSLPLDLFGSLLGVDKYRKDPHDDKEAGSDFSRWGFFATGTYAHGSGDARVERPGFSIDNAGLTAGVDYRFSDRLVAGIAAGYGHNSTDIERSSGSMSADGYSVSAYATWYQPNDIYLDASLSQSWTDYALSRSIVYQIADGAGANTAVNQLAKASPGGEQRSLAFSFGKYFHHEALEWNPFVRAQYLRVNLDGFDETLSDPNGPGGGLATHADAHSQTDLLGILGLHASYTMSRDWGILIPNAQLEWNHEFDHTSNNATLRFVNDPTGTPIALSDPRTNANFFTLGIGVNVVLPQGRSGYILLQHTSAAQGVTENRLSIGGRMEF